MGRTLFITGTGTGVGKSALSLAAMIWARARGLSVVYFKPVQCGDFPFGNPPLPHGDAEWIRAMLSDAPDAPNAEGAAAAVPVETHVTYRFPSPVSPHLAAEREGVEVLAERIREDLENLEEDKDLVVMEGAGGAAVPLDRQGNSLAVIAAELEIPCLLACAPGLGTLHHTLSTLAYLGALEAPVAGFFRIMQGFALAGGVLAIILGLLHRQPSQGRLLTAWDESLWFALLFLICRAGTRLCAT